MDSGSDILLTEGSTVFSQHMASLPHEKGDATIKTLATEANWTRRGIREAIEIRRNKVTLNQDGGRYKLSAIYQNIITPEKTVARTTTSSANFNGLQRKSPRNGQQDRSEEGLPPMETENI